MQLQDVVVLGLSMAALILSILAIIFEIVFFYIQAKQANAIMKDNSSFTGEMKILLNEIRITQDITGQQVKDQFDKVLDVAIGKKGDPAEIAADSAINMEELNKRFQSLETAVNGINEPEKLRRQISDLGKSLEEMKMLTQKLVSGVTRVEMKRPASASRFEKFSERARRVLTGAQDEARILNQNYIGAEHILLAISKETDCLAYQILLRLGLNLVDIERTIQFVLGSKTSKESTEQVGLTPSGRAVVEIAVNEAKELGHRYVGTEHLLLGILNEHGVAASILEKLGVTREKVISKLLDLLTTKRDKRSNFNG